MFALFCHNLAIDKHDTAVGVFFFFLLGNFFIRHIVFDLFPGKFTHLQFFLQLWLQVSIE